MPPVCRMNGFFSFLGLFVHMYLRFMVFYATDNNSTNCLVPGRPISIFSCQVDSGNWDSDGFMVWESFIHNFLLSPRNAVVLGLN